MKSVKFTFRWPIRGGETPNEVIMEVPTGPNGVPAINEAFSELHRLSDAEHDRAELAVIKSIAIVSGPE